MLFYTLQPCWQPWSAVVHQCTIAAEQPAAGHRARIVRESTSCQAMLTFVCSADTRWSISASVRKAVHTSAHWQRTCDLPRFAALRK